MIDIISNWAGELVVSLIIVTLIEMLLPENKIKKYVKTVIGVYIIFCIISPFIDKQQFATIWKNTEKELEKIRIESRVVTSKETTSSIEKLYIQEFEKEISQKVEKLGYTVKKCEVKLEIDATKESASINEIYLKLGDKKENNKKNMDIQVENIQRVQISINNSKEGNNNDKHQEDTKEIQELKEILSQYYEISKEKIKITQD